MKFNGAIFSKPQQDQLKENIGNELEKISAKVDELETRVPTKIEYETTNASLKQLNEYIRNNSHKLIYVDLVINITGIGEISVVSQPQISAYNDICIPCARRYSSGGSRYLDTYNVIIQKVGQYELYKGNAFENSILQSIALYVY